MEKSKAKENAPLVSDASIMTDKDKALLKRKLMKFVCGTCDMATSATPQQCEALPKVADILCRWF